MLIEVLFEDAMGSSIRLDSCNQALSRLYMFRDEVASHNETKYSLISLSLSYVMSMNKKFEGFLCLFRNHQDAMMPIMVNVLVIRPFERCLAGSKVQE